MATAASVTGHIRRIRLCREVPAYPGQCFLGDISTLISTYSGLPTRDVLSLRADCEMQHVKHIHTYLLVGELCLSARVYLVLDYAYTSGYTYLVFTFGSDFVSRYGMYSPMYSAVLLYGIRFKYLAQHVCMCRYIYALQWSAV